MNPPPRATNPPPRAVTSLATAVAAIQRVYNTAGASGPTGSRQVALAAAGGVARAAAKAKGGVWEGVVEPLEGVLGKAVGEAAAGLSTQLR
eukprot:5303155-Pyramimonas_sp.AAC.1